jgi:hypothetical protein
LVTNLKTSSKFLLDAQAPLTEKSSVSIGILLDQVGCG